jgi:hypothetical protein
MTSVNEMNAVMQERARLREEVVKLRRTPVGTVTGDFEATVKETVALADVLALLHAEEKTPHN